MTDETLVLHQRIGGFIQEEQTDILPARAVAPANKALENMVRIFELLPKPPPQQNQQQQQNQQHSGNGALFCE